MCWIGKHNFKKAEKDIPIFKILKNKEGKLYSVYKYYPYYLHKVVNSEILITNWYNKDTCKINKALHSYNPKIILIKNYSFYIALYTTLGRIIDCFNCECGYVKVKGIIPKGSQYMENEQGEFVSNQLILQEIEELWKV